jgi:hypothetical protein
VSDHDFVEAVGRDAITRRLRRLEVRLDGLSDELAANQREYEELQSAYRTALAEHDQLSTKLRLLDIGEIEEVPV